MTNQEAQNALANLKRYMSGGGAVDRVTNKAIDIAIEALDAQPEQPKKTLYKHFKGGIYELLCNDVKHTETGETLVIYRDLSLQIWARPQSEFYGLVFSDGEYVPRFVLYQGQEEQKEGGAE